jgi:hypothetical protein
LPGSPNFPEEGSMNNLQEENFKNWTLPITESGKKWNSWRDGIPIFRPTWDEFKGFPRYVHFMESLGYVCFVLFYEFEPMSYLTNLSIVF